MARQRDKYDEAIDYLTKNPDKIQSAWRSPWTFEGGVLFQWASPDGRGSIVRNQMCGCLTQIRESTSRVVVRRDGRVSRVLTKEIREDTRIPDHSSKLRKSHLKRFAYWQRRLDKELGR